MLSIKILIITIGIVFILSYVYYIGDLSHYYKFKKGCKQDERNNNN